MSFALKKAIKKELLNTDWAGKVEEPAVAAFADVIEQHYGGQLSGLHDVLKRCTTGKLMPSLPSVFGDVCGRSCLQIDS